MGKLKLEVVSVNASASNLTEDDEGNTVKNVTETVILRATGYAGNDDQTYPATGELTVSLPEGAYTSGQQIEADLTVTADAPPPAPSSSPTGSPEGEQRLDKVENEVEDLDKRVDALEGQEPAVAPSAPGTEGGQPA